jgi:hypothetical protein
MFQSNKNKFWGGHVALAASGIAFAAMVGAVSGIIAPASARAAVINPGDTYFFTATDAEAMPAGTIIKNQTNPFTGTNGATTVFTGTIQSVVIVDASTGDDDFVYQLSNNAGSTDTIDKLTLDSFAGFTTNIGYVPGNTEPTYVTRSTDGSTLGFNFLGPEILQGTSSDFLVVMTNSTSWVEGNGSVIDGGIGSAAVTVPTFSIMNNVPEPTTASLISIGGALLMARRRRS